MRTQRNWRARATPQEEETLTAIDAERSRIAQQDSDLRRLRERIANRLCQRDRYEAAKKNSGE